MGGSATASLNFNISRFAPIVKKGRDYNRKNGRKKRGRPIADKKDKRFEIRLSSDIFNFFLKTS